MQKIIVITGLPGSGKTTYLKNHSEEFGDAFICDDYYKSAPGRLVQFDGSIYYGPVRQALEEGKNVVIADIVFCEKGLRKDMQEGIAKLVAELNIQAQVEYRFFENAPEACIGNILQRNQPGRVQEQLAFVAGHRDTYRIPEGAIVLPVHRIK